MTDPPDTAAPAGTPGDAGGDAGSGSGALTPRQLAELREAGERSRRILSAARVATFNGWTIGVFAGLTLLFGLSSPTALMLGVGMAVVTRNEFRGRKLLRRLDPEGPRILGVNQLGLMALIVGYALVSIYRTVYGPGPDLGDLESVIGPTEDLVIRLTVAVYAGVIAATVLFQGLMARYYFRRATLLKEYLAETPDWVVEIQRAAAGSGGAGVP